MNDLPAAVLAQAVQRLQDELAAVAPAMAAPVAGWMQALAGGEAPADYFTHPLAFPTLNLPWWVAQGLGTVPDPALQAELAYSSINGYYFIRMVDNVMDREATVETRLLPALAFFHTEFQGAYQALFPRGHPFWALYRRVWIGTAEAAVEDGLTPDITLQVFEQASARKVGAALIPVSAVCHVAGRAQAVDAWAGMVYRLGKWHQMFNDVFDWHKDSAHGNPTYFLCEAQRRRRDAESAAEWIVREGFAQGCDTLRQWLRDARLHADSLGCAPLVAYLDARAVMLDHRAAQAQAGFDALRRLAAAFR